MSDDLVSKLLQFNMALTEAEKANFKLLLGLAAGRLAGTSHRLERANGTVALDVVTDSLAALQPYSRRIPRNGIAYRGRPPLMTDELLDSLQDEARRLRPSAQRFDEHFLGCGAPIANRLAVAGNLCALVRQHAGDVKPTGIASFLFYDEEGQGIDPHIDTDTFSLNVLLMLRHDRVAESTSALIVFPPHGEPERLELMPGEMVIMFAGSIAHGRERMKRGETVSILTFGFRPLGT